MTTDVVEEALFAKTEDYKTSVGKILPLDLQHIFYKPEDEFVCLKNVKVYFYL